MTTTTTRNNDTKGAYLVLAWTIGARHGAERREAKPNSGYRPDAAADLCNAWLGERGMSLRSMSMKRAKVVASEFMAEYRSAYNMALEGRLI